MFVTGAEGFVGGHLLEHLSEQGHELFGTAYSKDLLGDHIPPAAQVEECDICDRDATARLLQEVRPAAVVHLAAMSSVSTANSNPDAAARVNILGTFNILQAASELQNKPRVLFVSTCEVYGAVSEADCPLTEDHRARPQSIYAASKASAEVLAAFFERAHDLPVVTLRPFNHTGPRQAPHFVCSSFARQIARIEAGVIEPVIYVGNLEARRDFLDVRDVARAYTLAAELGEPGTTYNVCSGRAMSIRHVLDILLSMTDVDIAVQTSKELLRPLDIRLLVGSHRRFTEATGWVPRIPFEKTLEDLLDYWRADSESSRDL